MNIYPDGGVARLKLLGNLDVSKLKFPNKKFDLLSILNGSKIVACSDEHFGRAENYYFHLNLKIWAMVGKLKEEEDQDMTGL